MTDLERDLLAIMADPANRVTVLGETDRQAIAAALARVAELEADAARLDWLGTWRDLTIRVFEDHQWRELLYTEAPEAGPTKTLRAAIDRAMKGNG